MVEKAEISADVKVVPRKAKPGVEPKVLVVVGFLIRYKSTRKYIRRRFLEHVELQRKPDQEKKVYTKMPCGREYVFTYLDFPATDMPCDCGNPTHWVVKYERVNPGLPTPVESDSPSLFPKDGRKEGEEETRPETIPEGEVPIFGGDGI